MSKAIVFDSIVILTIGILEYILWITFGKRYTNKSNLISPYTIISQVNDQNSLEFIFAIVMSVSIEVLVYEAI